LENMLKDYHNPEELVTLSSEIPFNQAVEVLNEVSIKITGQRIVSTAGYNEPIGIEINNMPYKRALKIITQYNNLVYEEKPDVIIIKKLTDEKADLSADVYAPVSAREVKISAIFFEANVSEMRERGINWQFLLSRSGLNIGSSFKTFLEDRTATSDGTGAGGTGSSAQQQSPPDFNVTSSSEFEMGKFSGTAAGIFKFFEEENLGEIIARPNISVRNGKAGKIQIGEDISIKQRDFAGNVIDVFYPTGTIIEVTPYIYNEEGIDYILLKIKAERSSPITISETTTRISKTNANTEVLMLDGEKTAIGGLFVNTESTSRRGIPFLKDLPWWVFGLRYVFGYDSKEISKKEVIIMLEADILPTLRDRIEEKKENINVIQQEREKQWKAIEKYRMENMEKKKEDEEK